LRGDQSRIASFISGGSERLRLLLYVAVAMLGLGISGVIFSYLSTSLALPLRDQELSAIDTAIGFDWPGFLAWTDRHTLVVHALVWAYHTSGTQLLLVYIFLAANLDEHGVKETVAIQAACSVFVAIGMTLVPAVGAYAYYRPEVHNYSVVSGMWHYQTFMALRNNVSAILNFAHLQGLVTFPSFHTVLALLIPFAIRNYRPWFWTAAGVNLLVIFGTITEGGHHLTDVIAGAAIFIGCASAVVLLGEPSSKKAAGKLVASQPLQGEATV
jgi:membrane-associated phospholipid phosphatase